MSNISLQNKLTGTPLVFSSSLFHLLHVASLKFLALNDSNLEDLQFELVDFPNENTVLRFNPCLNFQKLRTNVVYHGDVVCLSAQKQVCNRGPNLFTTYQGTYYEHDQQDTDKYLHEVQMSQVWASLDESSQWRVNIYSSYNYKDECIQVGDVIGLNLTE